MWCCQIWMWHVNYLISPQRWNLCCSSFTLTGCACDPCRIALCTQMTNWHVCHLKDVEGTRRDKIPNWLCMLSDQCRMHQAHSWCFTVESRSDSKFRNNWLNWGILHNILIDIIHVYCILLTKRCWWYLPRFCLWYMCNMYVYIVFNFLWEFGLRCQLWVILNNARALPLCPTWWGHKAAKILWREHWCWFRQETIWRHPSC